MIYSYDTRYIIKCIIRVSLILNTAVSVSTGCSYSLEAYERRKEEEAEIRRTKEDFHTTRQGSPESKLTN